MQGVDSGFPDAGIDAWIEGQMAAYEQILGDFVAIPSIAVPGVDGYPYGKPCADALAFLAGHMQEMELQVEDIDSQVVIGTLAGTEQSPVIGIACHADVVPVSGGWEKDPFTMWRKGDWFVGRGTTDNKGATIACLFALKYLKEHYPDFGSTVRLYVGSAEEIGMPDMDYYADTHPVYPDFTLVPDAGFPGVYGEKGNIKIVLKADIPQGSIRYLQAGTGASVIDYAEVLCETGSLMVHGNGECLVESGSDGIKVSSKGLARHAAMPEGGKDALHSVCHFLSTCLEETKAAAVFQELSVLGADFSGTEFGIACADDLSGPLTCVMTKAKYDGINPLYIWMNIRYPITVDYQDLERKIMSRLQRSPFSLDSLVHSPSTQVPLSPVIYGLADIANNVYGTHDEPYTMSGGTYARKFPNAIAYGMGIPSLNHIPPFPEGQGRAHQPNESVFIPRMKNGMKIYIQALHYLDKVLKRKSYD